MADPQISVIMGTVNPEYHQIKAAVDSIRRQTLKEWEFIIYDDGSDGQGKDSIRKAAGDDGRIRYINGVYNCGLAHALNECIKTAKGDYIARMDDDDISYPERLEKQRDFLREYPEYGWVSCLADLFDEKGIWGLASRPEEPQKKDFLKYSPFVHPGVMFRKDILLKENGYCEDKLTARCEDYELFMRLYSRGYRGYNIQERLLAYRSDSKGKKRNWRYCYNESVIRAHGFKEMGFGRSREMVFVLKPLLVFGVFRIPGLAQKIRLDRSSDDHAVRTNTGKGQNGIL